MFGMYGQGKLLIVPALSPVPLNYPISLQQVGRFGVKHTENPGILQLCNRSMMTTSSTHTLSTLASCGSITVTPVLDPLLPPTVLNGEQ